ncbi:M1 family metallopeptidase [Sporolactobacillus sp. STCC-11]|uniref:M1 family metallopeptidase n=1 Tax=Sporolactobacillus caesalpiniae TaxID=3230362 RepID=UPI00339B025A
MRIKLIVIGVIFTVFIVTLYIFESGKKIHSQAANEIQKNNTKKMQQVFVPKSVPAGNQSDYTIHLSMKKGGTFHVNARVEIKNTSSDSWDKLVFYFIPNMFTKKNDPSAVQPATNRFNTIKVNGLSNSYRLARDKLSIPLKTKLRTGEQTTVSFSYVFTVPKGGKRFTQRDGNFYLAQFYPMIATYRNHAWNAAPYQLINNETYHTTFSDFNVTYDIPQKYTLVSSGEKDMFPSKSKGTFSVRKIKEVFIALLKEPYVTTVKEDNTIIRIFGFNKEECEEIRTEAASAFKYYEHKIGRYPFGQLDIVLGGLGMEYPGIVTAGYLHDFLLDLDSLKREVDHEIAHQWFYGVVSNDPYHDGWLDEGMVTFAQGLLTVYRSKKVIDYTYIDKMVKEYNKYPVNLPLDQYPPTLRSTYIYGKASSALFELFKHRGGREGAEKFLNTYYHYYQYKEVDSKEFMRFVRYYFNVRDNSIFKNWLTY